MLNCIVLKYKTEFAVFTPSPGHCLLRNSTILSLGTQGKKKENEKNENHNILALSLYFDM